MSVARLATMGNASASSLPFEITGTVDYKAVGWTFHTGAKKSSGSTDKVADESLTIFRLSLRLEMP